jgi:hypothetical protein
MTSSIAMTNEYFGLKVVFPQPARGVSRGAPGGPDTIRAPQVVEFLGHLLGKLL